MDGETTERHTTRPESRPSAHASQSLAEEKHYCHVALIRDTQHLQHISYSLEAKVSKFEPGIQGSTTLRHPFVNTCQTGLSNLLDSVLFLEKAAHG